NNLAWMYYHGEGTAKDYQKSFYWYKKAESSGEPLVLYMLGQSHLLGRGTVKSQTQAYEYYHKAYGKGLPVADLRVGLDYYFGISTPKNIEKGKKFIFSSAESGHPAAQFIAGYIELEQKNKDKAIFWLKAADKNNYHLANLLLTVIAEEEGNYLQAAKQIVSAMPLLVSSNVSIEVE
ncbi:MAG: sel1 repeat family protein, partial [Kangiellaceae bacterium]|nr:sel1 repeat family protein [Kangiellaceae bacterium]